MIPKHNLVTAYPWHKEISEKVFAEKVKTGEADTDYPDCLTTFSAITIQKRWKMSYGNWTQ